jgi:hypothetical protein
MADFDPKAFLAEDDAKDDFDPKAFLAAPDETINEQHSKLDLMDRMVVKNFGNNLEDSIGYLKKRHPTMEFKTDKDGEIIARDTGEKEYRMLDPQGFWNSISHPLTELPKDLGDVATDVATGVGSTLATAAGGIAGAAAGGIGALPGAALAGGAASTGMEGLKQGIANALGVQNGVDGTGLALSGGVGMASPLLFGTGAGTGAAAKSAFRQLGPGASTEALEGLAESTLKQQRGGLGITYDALKNSKLGTKVGDMVGNASANLASTISGAPAESIKTLAKRHKEYNALEADPEGVLKFLDETGGVIDDNFRAAKTKTWDAFNEAIDGAGDAPTVDVTPITGMFQEAIQEADKKAAGGRGTDASKELGDRLRKAFNHYLVGEEKQTIPTLVKKPTGLLDEMGQPIMKDVEELTEQVVRSPNTALSPRAAIELERDLADMAGFSKLKDKVAGNRFSPSDSVEDKELMTLAAKLKKALGQQTDAVVPSHALPLRRQYGELVEMEKSIDKLVQTPRQAFTNLRNSDFSSNVTNKQLLHKIDRVLPGSDLEKRAQMAEAFETFSPGRKSFFSDLKNKASIPAGFAGTALGYYAGRQTGDTGNGILGGLAGGGVGAMLGGPKALRTYINLQKMVQQGARRGKELGLSPQVGARSVWEMLQDKPNKK